jgi:mono/diheme cytochrome c family protein
MIIHKILGSVSISAVCLIAAAACVEQESESLLERGTYLANSIVACGNCHTPKNADGSEIEDMEFAGNFNMEEPQFTAYAPNITPDIATGIGAWSDEEIVRAIRDGVRPDGSIIGPPMPSLFYRNMSDRDANAIVAYIRSVKPLKNVMPRSVYRMQLPSSWGPPVGEVPDVSKDDPLAYANYVTNALGHCMECHTPRAKDGELDWEQVGLGGRVFSGAFGVDSMVVALNITPHETAGIGTWSDAEIRRTIVDGVSRDGRPLEQAMGFGYYKNISAEDADAIVLYVKSLKPLPVNE